MSKNVGSFLAFNKAWFTKHQRLLLWLLNAPAIKVWFRWILRIRKTDCSLATRITEIQPNSFSYGDRYFKKKGKWYVEKRTDFRTHPKYGKRLYYAFRPAWWLVHFWDWAIADRYIPNWSYGFSTLTVYPDANTETTSVDGWVRRDTNFESWSTIRNGAGTDKDDTGSSDFCIRILAEFGAGHADQWAQIYRSIFLFDTSALTSGATISAAIMSLNGTNKYKDSFAPDINIYTSNPASNTALAAADFTTLGTTAQCDTAITYAGWSTSGYNDFTLNSTGRGNISKTGVTKFGARNATWDAANSSPTWASNHEAELYCNYADNSGTSADPKLVITYTASTAYTLTSAQGSYALTGEATAFHVGHIITAVKGAFTLTGQSTAFKIAHTLVAAFGSYALTGFTAGLKIARTLIAAVGTYTLSGYSITVLYGKILTATVGNFVLSGQSAVLSSTRRLIAALGTYTLTGQTTLFKITRTLTAAFGTYILSGQSSIFSYGRRMAAASGSYALTGITTLFRLARKLIAAFGSYVLTGEAVRFFLNGISTPFSDKYSIRNSSYSDKNSSRGTSYTDKYSHLR